MVFKLIRTDADENCRSCKIHLPQGTHLLGRGKLLECNDVRVSRKHGELTVGEDCIQMKALHQNPCFYIRKSKTDVQILKQNCIVELGHGDKFGLLPNTFWFEVIYCATLDTEENNQIQQHEQVNVVTESNILNTGNTVTSVNESENNEQTNTLALVNDTANVFGDDDEDMINFDLNESLGNLEREGSPSMIQDPVTESRHESPSRQQALSPAPNTAVPSSPTRQYQLPPLAPEPSPTKRTHSPEVPDTKRIKTEPVEVKQEPITEDQGVPDMNPGPSQDRGQERVKTEPVEVKQEPVTPNQDPGPSLLNTSNPDPAAANPPPAAVGRERCWYGASCYRKNPVHKAQFSHPSDSDWGVESRAACPYGRSCRKTDPRHWRDHLHPSEARPPGESRPRGESRPPKQRATKKRKRIVEDSEEDSPSLSSVEDLIVTGKRQRKPVRRESNMNVSDLESDNEDPYDTDGSDEWIPDNGKLSGDASTQSQDFSQDT